MRTLKVIFIAALIVMFTAVGHCPIFADDTRLDISMVIGDLEAIPVKNLTRVSVTSPDIADIADAQTDKVMILGKNAGQTAVFLWDEEGKHTVSVHVVSQDLKLIADRIGHLFQEAEITHVNLEANASEGKVVLTGQVSKDKKRIFDKILESYNDQVINLVKEESNQDLIQIDMQITELGTTLDKNLGIDWQGGAVGSSLNLNYAEQNVPTGGSQDWFKFGKFNRTTSIINTVNLMIREGKARDLSRPRILVSSGKEATINVGGEVPIQSITTSSSGGTQTANTTFKQYGVTLTVTPTIKEGKIDVVMNLQISDVDKTFTIQATKTSDIAYKTRSAQTQLLLDDRQTVVFAGLIRYNDSEQNRRVPFFGKLPIVGALFRNTSKSAPDEGKELVITLTPTIMRTIEKAKEQIQMPSETIKAFTKEVDAKQENKYEKIDAAATVEKSAAPTVSVFNNGRKEAPVKADLETPQMNYTQAIGNSNMSYIRSVQTKVSQNISFPMEAYKNNWEGTVKLKLHILKDGSLQDVTIVDGSGQDVFDKDALNAAKNAAPFDPFDASIKLDYLNITLPIVYNRGTSKNTETVVPTY